jgi:hypothetical protein
MLCLAMPPFSETRTIGYESENFSAKPFKTNQTKFQHSLRKKTSFIVARKFQERKASNELQLRTI